MPQNAIRFVLVSGLVLPFGGIAAASSAIDPNPRDAATTEEVGDAHREMQILTAFGRNPRLQAFDFSVSVDVATAVLGGTVDDRANRDLAEKIAIDVDGIRFVVNHIVVDADYMRLQHARND